VLNIACSQNILYTYIIYRNVTQYLSDTSLYIHYSLPLIIIFLLIHGIKTITWPLVQIVQTRISVVHHIPHLLFTWLNS